MQQLTSKFKSDFITCDTLKGEWLAENYNFRELEIVGEKIIRGKSIYKDFGFKPEELVYQKNSTNLMTLPELHKFVKKNK